MGGILEVEVLLCFTALPTKARLKLSTFSRIWDQERIAEVPEHCESQTEEEALAQEEAALELVGQTLMEVLTELVPAASELLAKHKAARRRTRRCT
jgi:hypothetical protein